MEIKLNLLKLVNFKGKTFELKPEGKNINIYGANEAGKTTLFDAFLWIKFNKNSQGKSQFDIKPLDKNNKVIPGLSPEVSETLLIDGLEYPLKKTYKEVWTKPTGKEYKELKTHTTDYEYDNIDKSPTEYKDKIKGIIDENLFRLITSPKYFQSLDWKERRNLLKKLVPSVNNGEILDEIVTNENKDAYNGLIGILNQGKNIAEYYDKIKKQIKKLKDSIAEIPILIKEKKRELSLIEVPNFEEVKRNISLLELDKEKIQEQIQDKSEAHKKVDEIKLEKQKDVYRLNKELLVLENNRANNQLSAKSETENKIRKIENIIKGFSEDILEKQSFITKNSKKISDFETRTDILTDEFMELNKKEPDFDNLETECPLFKFPLHECSHSASFLNEKKEEIKANFNVHLKKKKDEINTEGVGIVEKIGILQKENLSLNDEIKKLKKSIELETKSIELVKSTIKKPEENPSIPVEETDIKEKIKALEGDISFYKPIDNTEEIKKRNEIQEKIDILNKKLGVKETIDNNNARVFDLTEKEKALSIEIANLEKEEFAIENFDKAKINAIEGPINAKFKYVKFKMYNKLMNKGSEPCCITLIGGVPYNSANNAAQINSGLDIINTFCKFNNVYAPVWIDNAESVTDLIETKSQMIRLIVSKPDVELRVEFEN